jgi:Spy/CpxP family protein refolding chaperone
MKIKKIAIGCTVFVLSIIGVKAYAHSTLSLEEKAKHITERMAQELDLTEDQKTKVYKINLERSQGHQKAYEQGRNKEIIVKAVQQWENDLKNVLTAAQQKKLKL